MDENYEKVLKLCDVMIKEDFGPCGLDQEIRKQLLELVLEWEKRKQDSESKGDIGGLQWLCSCIRKVVGEAFERSGGYSKGDPKLRCHYLKKALEKGEIGNCFRTWAWKEPP